MDVTIYGSGYVGLVTAACFAQIGNNVLCVDVNAPRINKLKKGIVPIHEPGLQKLIELNAEKARIEFTSDMQAGVEHGSFQFISVGTPLDANGSADLQQVLTVAKDIGLHMSNHKIIITKSTVPVGTTTKVKHTIQKQLDERDVKIEFDVVSNPEFLKEGAAIKDFMKPDRIIVGTESPRAIEAMHKLYAPFNRNHDRMLFMDPASAELTKYAANVMLAAKISLMNEFANIAERLDADIEQVRLGIGLDHRIGYHFIYPGCGYGGSCFPKDVKALQHAASEAGHTPTLIAAVEQVNQRQKQVLYDKIYGFFNGDLDGKVIALWGLSFKPNTDDMREAPSRELMHALWKAGVKVQAYDPAAMDECQRIYGEHLQLQLCDHANQALNSADALAIVTEWNEFKAPDFKKIKNTLAYPVIFDGRNIYDPGTVEQFGIKYYTIGRGTPPPLGPH